MVKLEYWYIQSLKNELEARKHFPNSSQNRKRIQQLEQRLKGVEE